jgi:hypothetical protein
MARNGLFTVTFATAVSFWLQAGREILAKHQIKEGIPLCLDIMKIDRWEKRNRISKCLKNLQAHGEAAKPLLPRLSQLEKQLALQRESRGLQSQIDLLRQAAEVIKTDAHPHILRALFENH